MIELGAVMYVMMGVFGFIGYQRGLSKELISLAGIILALFALFQFNNLLLNVLLANVPPEQKFVVQCLLFGTIVFFAYQTRGLGRKLANDSGRDSLQSTILGTLMGAVNGYLIWGSPVVFHAHQRLPAVALHFCAASRDAERRYDRRAAAVLAGGRAKRRWELVGVCGHFVIRICANLDLKQRGRAQALRFRHAGSSRSWLRCTACCGSAPLFSPYWG
jgi:uncharacterized membrane protein required for colicin V production